MMTEMVCYRCDRKIHFEEFAKYGGICAECDAKKGLFIHKLQDRVVKAWQSVPAMIKVSDFNEVYDQVRRDLQQAFEEDKTNFTNYKSYSIFLKWFGDSETRR